MKLNIFVIVCGGSGRKASTISMRERSSSSGSGLLV